MKKQIATIIKELEYVKLKEQGLNLTRDIYQDALLCFEIKSADNSLANLKAKEVYGILKHFVDENNTGNLIYTWSDIFNFRSKSVGKYFDEFILLTRLKSTTAAKVWKEGMRGKFRQLLELEESILYQYSNFDFVDTGYIQQLLTAGEVSDFLFSLYEKRDDVKAVDVLKEAFTRDVGFIELVYVCLESKILSNPNKETVVKENKSVVPFFEIKEKLTYGTLPADVTFDEMKELCRMISTPNGGKIYPHVLNVLQYTQDHPEHQQEITKLFKFISPTSLDIVEPPRRWDFFKTALVNHAYMHDSQVSEKSEFRSRLNHTALNMPETQKELRDKIIADRAAKHPANGNINTPVKPGDRISMLDGKKSICTGIVNQLGFSYPFTPGYTVSAEYQNATDIIIHELIKLLPNFDSLYLARIAEKYVLEECVPCLDAKNVKDNALLFAIELSKRILEASTKPRTSQPAQDNLNNLFDHCFKNDNSVKMYTVNEWVELFPELFFPDYVQIFADDLESLKYIHKELSSMKNNEKPKTDKITEVSSLEELVGKARGWTDLKVEYDGNGNLLVSGIPPKPQVNPADMEIKGVHLKSSNKSKEAIAKEILGAMGVNDSATQRVSELMVELESLISSLEAKQKNKHVNPDGTVNIYSLIAKSCREHKAFMEAIKRGDTLVSTGTGLTGNDWFHRKLHLAQTGHNPLAGVSSMVADCVNCNYDRSQPTGKGRFLNQLLNNPYFFSRVKGNVRSVVPHLIPLSFYSSLDNMGSEQVTKQTESLTRNIGESEINAKHSSGDISELLKPQVEDHIYTGPCPYIVKAKYNHFDFKYKMKYNESTGDLVITQSYHGDETVIVSGMIRTIAEAFEIFDAGRIANPAEVMCSEAIIEAFTTKIESYK